MSTQYSMCWLYKEEMTTFAFHTNKSYSIYLPHDSLKTKTWSLVDIKCSQSAKSTSKRRERKSGKLWIHTSVINTPRLIGIQSSTKTKGELTITPLWFLVTVLCACVYEREGERNMREKGYDKV